MANETIGSITCGWCGDSADVRKAARGKRKLYVMCPNCGQQWLNLPAGQDVILERAQLYGAGGPPEKVVNDNEPEPLPPPVNEKKQEVTPQKRRGFFDFEL